MSSRSVPPNLASRHGRSALADHLHCQCCWSVVRASPGRSNGSENGAWPRVVRARPESLEPTVVGTGFSFGRVAGGTRCAESTRGTECRCRVAATATDRVRVIGRALVGSTSWSATGSGKQNEKTRPARSREEPSEGALDEGRTWEHRDHACLVAWARPKRSIERILSRPAGTAVLGSGPTARPLATRAAAVDAADGRRCRGLRVPLGAGAQSRAPRGRRCRDSHGSGLGVHAPTGGRTRWRSGVRPRSPAPARSSRGSVTAARLANSARTARTMRTQRERPGEAAAFRDPRRSASVRGSTAERHGPCLHPTRRRWSDDSRGDQRP